MRTRPTTLIAFALTAAAAVGAAAYVVARAGDEPFRNSPEASRALDQIDPGRANGLAGASLGVDAPPLSPPAASPEAAVRGLLDALIAGDAEGSFSLLAAADRAALGPLSTWRDRQPARPRYLGYQVTGVEGDAVIAEVSLEARLDEVIGFVPAQATATWRTVPEDGGYRVAYSESTTEPSLPADGDASQAAEAWVAGQQRCEDGPTYDGNLLGQPALADALCHQDGSYRAGPAEALDRFRDPALVLNAFGADAAAFVRVVPVDGPVPMQLALAPLGAEWEVVGLVQR